MFVIEVMYDIAWILNIEIWYIYIYTIYVEFGVIRGWWTSQKFQQITVLDVFFTMSLSTCQTAATRRTKTQEVRSKSFHQLGWLPNRSLKHQAFWVYGWPEWISTQHPTQFPLVLIWLLLRQKKQTYLWSKGPRIWWCVWCFRIQLSSWYPSTIWTIPFQRPMVFWSW